MICDISFDLIIVFDTPIYYSTSYKVTSVLKWWYLVFDKLQAPVLLTSIGKVLLTTVYNIMHE